MTFTLEDIEKRFFSMDEQHAHDQVSSHLACSDMANSLQKGKWHNGKNHGGKGNKSFCGKQGKPVTTHANATNGRTIICYNCGEPDHIAPQCPHPKVPKNSRTSKAATAQSSTSGNTSPNEIVCSTRVINLTNNNEETRLEQDNDVQATRYQKGH
jgi:hypothetical protein